MKLKRISQLEVALAAIAISVALCLRADVAQADVIVDTGSTGPVTNTSAALYGTQWLAAEFNVTTSVTINQIQGWIYSGYNGPYPGSGGQLTVAIYTSSNSTPVSVIDAATVNVPNNAPLGWIGPTGLTWALAPGQYWVAFEVQAFSSFVGYMPGSSSSPLPTDFLNNPYLPGSVWAGPVVSSQNIGVQISGSVSSVSPIPLNIQSISNNVIVSWSDPASVFTLQAAPTINGIFSNVPSATNPYTNAIAGTQQYFRLVAPAN